MPEQSEILAWRIDNANPVRHALPLVVNWLVVGG
jgi:hypothetical protein